LAPAFQPIRLRRSLRDALYRRLDAGQIVDLLPVRTGLQVAVPFHREFDAAVSHLLRDVRDWCTGRQEQTRRFQRRWGKKTKSLFFSQARKKCEMKRDEYLLPIR